MYSAVALQTARHKHIAASGSPLPGPFHPFPTYLLCSHKELVAAWGSIAKL